MCDMYLCRCFGKGFCMCYTAAYKFYAGLCWFSVGLYRYYASSDRCLCACSSFLHLFDNSLVVRRLKDSLSSIAVLLAAEASSGHTLVLNHRGTQLTRSPTNNFVFESELMRLFTAYHMFVVRQQMPDKLSKHFLT